MQRETRLYELLVRFDAIGLPTAAHTIDMERVIDGKDVLSERALPAAPLDPEKVADLMTKESMTAIAEIVELRKQLAAADLALAELTAERDALASKIAARG